MATEVRRCIRGADKPPRCERPVAAGFDYCAICGERIGAALIQMPSEREKIHADHAARVKAARLKRPKWKVKS